MDINGIQKFLKGLNPFMMTPYTRNIYRNHPVALAKKSNTSS